MSTPAPGLRVEGPGCRVQGAGFRVQGSGFSLYLGIERSENAACFDGGCEEHGFRVATVTNSEHNPWEPAVNNLKGQRNIHANILTDSPPSLNLREVPLLL